MKNERTIVGTRGAPSRSRSRGASRTAHNPRRLKWLLCALPALPVVPQELGLATTRLAADPEEPAQRPIESEIRKAFVLEGFVLGPDGNPAEGAVVVSSAGGQAVTDVAGRYQLEIEVPIDATSVQLTAVG